MKSVYSLIAHRFRSMAPVAKHIQLESGDLMPIVGFGTWQAPEDELERAADLALEAGYKHFDAALAYENEAALGRAFKRFIGDNPERRKELFVCTKLHPSRNRPEHVEECFESSRKDLDLDYIDLYLIHTPFAFKRVEGDLHPKNPDGTIMADHTTDLVAVWKEMEKLVASGKVGNIGVSNFNIKQLDRILKIATVKPACNQVELHVFFQQKELLKECQARSVPLVAYSPLGSKGLVHMLSSASGKEYPDLLTHPKVVQIADAHGKTPAQILLRYTIERGVVVIPKSTNAARIKENISLFDFELTPADREGLASLDMGEDGRINDFSFLPGISEHPEFPFKK